jgi:hypothetical protein
MFMRRRRRQSGSAEGAGRKPDLAEEEPEEGKITITIFILASI